MSLGNGTLLSADHLAVWRNAPTGSRRPCLGVGPTGLTQRCSSREEQPLAQPPRSGPSPMFQQTLPAPSIYYSLPSAKWTWTCSLHSGGCRLQVCTQQCPSQESFRLARREGRREAGGSPGRLQVRFLGRALRPDPRVKTVTPL